MISVVLCILAFSCTLVAGRRSLVGGLAIVLFFGYAYGITRANITETFAHFIFDAAAVGLYFSQMSRRFDPEERSRLQKLRLWMGLLMLWPALLFFVPAQDRMVELVGLRGAVLLIPFLLIGARLRNDELYKLTLWIAGLNLLAFSLATAEYFMGVQNFYPRNPVTEIIYAGKDLVGFTEFRIPSSFTSAHAYAGTMVMTIPLLVGAWQQKRLNRWRGYFFSGAVIASILGVFMSAARTHAAVLFLLLGVATISSRFNWLSRIGWMVMLVGIGWTVSSEERLQRFVTLQDTEVVASRVYFSVNRTFFERALEYPLGNGLGGGGTSMPYFLRGLVKDPVLIENEYARIMLEEGIPGLCLWVAFIVWVFTRRLSRVRDGWQLGRRLVWFSCAAYFTLGLTGVGLLLSVPQTCVMLLCVGWMVVPQPGPVEKATTVYAGASGDQRISARQHA
ncbi:MAG: hypothetical protein WAV47_18665 [Blastocatellia bacterium]